MVSLLAIVALFTLVQIVPRAVSSKLSHSPRPSESQKLGGVSSLDARCSYIGVNILKRGGNAADAVRTSSAILPLSLTDRLDDSDAILSGSYWYEYGPTTLIFYINLE
jgi:hypothetical protein